MLTVESLDMGKYYYTLVFGMGLAVVLLGASGCIAAPQSRQERGSSCADDDALTSYVALPTGVSAEMLDPAWWAEHGSDGGVGAHQPLVSADAIKATGYAPRSPIVYGDGAELVLADVGEHLDGAVVRGLIETIKLPKKPKGYVLDGQPTDAAYWEDLKARERLDAIPDTVDVRFGFAVAWTTLRKFPSRDRLVSDDNVLFDRMATSNFKPFEPLAVVHESGDGAWYYCVMDGCAGWIEKENVALCADRDEWLRRQDPSDFLVVTDDSITLADVPGDDVVSGMRLPMGTRLELVRVADAPASMGARTDSNFCVKLPTRGSDGQIEDRLAYVPVSDDVSIGYCDLTRGSLLGLAFKHLGNVYGWSGDLHATDCSGLVCAVYACCGVRLPKTEAAMGTMAGFDIVDLGSMNDADKLKALGRAPSGSLVSFEGHVMMWLGEHEGKSYVISSVSSFADEAGDVQEVNSVCVNELSSTYRTDGRSWLTHLQTLMVPRGGAAS